MVFIKLKVFNFSGAPMNSKRASVCLQLSTAESDKSESNKYLHVDFGLSVTGSPRGNL